MRNNDDWMQIRNEFLQQLIKGPCSIRKFVREHGIELDNRGLLSLVNVAAMHALRSGNLFDVDSLINDFPNYSEAGFRATCSRAKKVIAESYCPKTDLELSLINGRFRLGDEVARDSTGIVYSASEDVESNLEIKLIFPWYGPAPSSLKTLMVDGHSGVSKLVDFGTIERMSYLVRVRPSGKSLAAMSMYPATLDVFETIDLIIKILDAVDHCHCMGLVFRRIRPEHIVVESGRPVLSNFEFSHSLGKPSLDDSSEINSVFEFVSPVAQDIFSLGALLYRMLTGINPFRFDSDGKYFRYPGEYRQEIDKDLERIVLNSISNTPSNQFKSARQFKESLESWRARIG